MEHRFNQRQSVMRYVDIHHRGQTLPRCRVRNISRGGLFVESTEGSFSTGVLVELSFHDVCNAQCVRAIVVHQTEQTMGLMFQDEERAFNLAKP